MQTNSFSSVLLEQVNELSRPSCSEVEEVIQELVQCTSRKFFKEETTSNSTGDLDVGSQENYPNDSDGFCDTIGTSRDYLAKLLFWLVYYQFTIYTLLLLWNFFRMGLVSGIVGQDITE